MSLRRIVYVATKPPRKGRSKTQSVHFKQQSFIGLTNRAKIIGGVRPLIPEILDQSDRVGVKSPIFDIFSLVAPQP